MPVITPDKVQFITSVLERASEAYYKGRPILSDAQYDRLEDLVRYDTVGYKNIQGVKGKHAFPLYSLNKYYPGEGKNPLSDYTGAKVDSPKLDGAAISLLYSRGILVAALTRGDGAEGEDIFDKASSGVIKGIPAFIEQDDDLPLLMQITGEVVAKASIPNSRNYVSGALGLKSLEEFATRELRFIAYDCYPSAFQYTTTLCNIKTLGFDVVTDSDWSEYPQDGRVVRVNATRDFDNMGYTSKFPRGAYALKVRKEGKETTLREVIWQTGKSGKVTPVAIFDPVDLGGASVTRATLNNPAYIKALDLAIGDTIEVARAGEIIPQVIRKVYDGV